MWDEEGSNEQRLKLIALREEEKASFLNPSDVRETVRCFPDAVSESRISPLGGQVCSTPISKYSGL